MYSKLYSVSCTLLVVLYYLSLHGTIHFSAIFFFFDRYALVVFLFTTAKSDDEFGASVFVDEEAEWYDGEAGRFCRILQCSDFLAVE